MFLKDYQPLIVGAVGFFGIIVTQIANAAIARNQRREDLDHERAALRRGLVEELRRLAGSVARVTETAVTAGAQGNRLVIPQLERTPIYDACINRLGLLTQDEIRLVTRAYDAAKDLFGKLSFFGRYEEKTPFLKVIVVPSENCAAANKVYEGHLSPMVEAIAVMEAKLG